MLIAANLIQAAAKVRDDLTAPFPCPQIYPMAMDVIAVTPMLAARLADEINRIAGDRP